MSTSRSDLVAAVDSFMAAKKRIVGAHSAPEWRKGFSPLEMEMKYPLEVEGELRGSHLMIVGFPREYGLKFRLGILFPAMVSRVDYTDETHVNSLALASDGVPTSVSGPHYHPWTMNRRFFVGTTKPPKLHNAVELACDGKSFDAVLRWFCAETNIESLPPDHMIELPRTDFLI